MRMEFNFGSFSRDIKAPKAAAGAPFRLALLGDFSGRGNRGEVAVGDELASRKPQKVDVDNLETLVGKWELNLKLPLGEDGSVVEVPVGSIDDLHPDQLFDNVSIFGKLAALRKKLKDPGTFKAAAKEVQGWKPAKPAKRAARTRRSAGAAVPRGKLSDFEELIGEEIPEPKVAAADALIRQIVGPHVVPAADPNQAAVLAALDLSISEAMRSILHHPDFQTVESLLRSLDFLVRRIETSKQLQIVVYDVSAQELAADLASSDNLEETGLFKWLVEQPVSDAHQGALSALVGLYQFEHIPPHAELLGRMASIASRAGAPFITAIGKEMLSKEADEPHDLTRDAWEALRAHPASAYLGLACNGFLLRQPYGKKSDAIDKFAFEEFTPREGLKGMLWANPALLPALLLAEMYQQAGFKMPFGKVMQVDDIPYYFFYDKDGDSTALPCTEKLLTSKVIAEAAGRRVMPVLAIAGKPEIRLGGWGSVAGANLAGPWQPAEVKLDAPKKAAPKAAAKEEPAEEKPAADSGSDADLDALLADLDSGSKEEAPAAASDSGSDADLDALLASLDSDDKKEEEKAAEEEMDPELAALLKDL